MSAKGNLTFGCHNQVRNSILVWNIQKSGDSEPYYDLSFGSLQVALTKIFYLLFLGFSRICFFLKFCPACKGQFCSWWLLPTKASG